MRSYLFALNFVTALSSSGMSFAGWKVVGSCFSKIYLKDTSKWLVCVATKNVKKKRNEALLVFAKTYPRVD